MAKQFEIKLRGTIKDDDTPADVARYLNECLILEVEDDEVKLQKVQIDVDGQPFYFDYYRDEDEDEDDEELLDI